MKTLFTMNRKRDIVLALLLTIFIICFAVIFTVFFKQLYYFDIDYLNITSTSGLSKEIIKENYKILIEYQSLFYRGALELPNFVMSQTGRIHFEEVKRVFEMIQIIFIGTGLMSAYMIYLNLRDKDYRFLQLTSYFSIGIPLILGFLVSIDFNKAFVIFHNIVFRNNYWVFDYTTDPVIQILPEDFFMHCFVLIVLIIILISIILQVIYKKKRKLVLKNH